jgi:hypothetical protein
MLLEMIVSTLTNYVVSNRVMDLGRNKETILNWLELKDKELFFLVQQLTDENFELVFNTVIESYQ